MLQGIPGYICSDNGLEFIAKPLREWIALVGTKTAYIVLGGPWENGYCESFNPNSVMNCSTGKSSIRSRRQKLIIEGWRRHYNTVRPHSLLNYKPPEPKLTVWP